MCEKCDALQESIKKVAAEACRGALAQATGMPLEQITEHAPPKEMTKEELGSVLLGLALSYAAFARTMHIPPERAIEAMIMQLQSVYPEINMARVDEQDVAALNRHSSFEPEHGSFGFLSGNKKPDTTVH